MTITTPDSVSSQILVAFQDPDSSSKRAEIFKKYDLKELEKIGPTELYLVEVSKKSSKTSQEIRKVISQISSEPGVKYAEPNFILKIPEPVQK